MLTTLALVLASSAQTNFVPVELGNSLWIVEAEVNGKRGKFQVSTNIRQTVIRDTFLEDQPKEAIVKVGNWQSKAIEVSYAKNLGKEKLDGLLGDNCFQNACLAFDNVNRILAIQSEPGQFSSWLQSENGTVKWLPLATNDDGLPRFTCSVAGKQINAALTSGVQFSRVDPDIVGLTHIKKLGQATFFDLDTSRDVMFDTGYVSELTVDTQNFPPIRFDFRSTPEGTDVQQISIIPDALGDKVLLDYKNRRLGFASLSPDLYATLLWRNIFQWTAQGSNSKLIVPERCRFLGPTQFSKAEVLEVGGIKASDLIKSLSAARKFQDIASLAELAETRYPVLFRTTNGLYRMNLKIDREK
jgi:hypothetical protein